MRSAAEDAEASGVASGIAVGMIESSRPGGTLSEHVSDNARCGPVTGRPPALIHVQKAYLRRRSRPRCRKVATPCPEFWTVSQASAPGVQKNRRSEMQSRCARRHCYRGCAESGHLRSRFRPPLSRNHVATSAIQTGKAGSAVTVVSTVPFLQQETATIHAHRSLRLSQASALLSNVLDENLWAATSGAEMN